MSIPLHTTALSKYAKKAIAFFRIFFWLAVYLILSFKKKLSNKTNSRVTELWFCDSSDSFKLANQASLFVDSVIVILDLGRRPRISNQRYTIDVHLFTYTRLLFLLFSSRGVTVFCVPHLHPSLLDPEFSLIFMSIGKSHLIGYDDGLRLAIGVSPASKYIPSNLMVSRYGWDFSPMPVMAKPNFPLEYKVDATKNIAKPPNNRKPTTIHVVGSRLLSPDLGRSIQEILTVPTERCLYYCHPNPTKDLGTDKMPRGTSRIPPLRDLVETLCSNVAQQDIIFIGFTSAVLVLLSLKQKNKLCFSRLILALDLPHTEIESFEIMRLSALISHQTDVVIL